MKTGSWRTYTGPGRVSISVGNPRGVVGGYRVFKPLAPTWAMLKMSERDYAVEYEKILALLDPQATVDKLHALAGGHEPILMCHEIPPFTATNRCHRRRVAAWLMDTIGLDVPELEIVKAI